MAEIRGQEAIPINGLIHIWTGRIPAEVLKQSKANLTYPDLFWGEFSMTIPVDIFGKFSWTLF